MKTSALTGGLLDYWVAMAVGLQIDGYRIGQVIIGVTPNRSVYEPSSNWKDGGPLLQSNQIFLEPPHDVHRLNYNKNGKPKGIWSTYESWHATVSARVRTRPNPLDSSLPGIVGRGEGDTALIAVCRAIVASVYGDEVQDEVAA